LSAFSQYRKQVWFLLAVCCLAAAAVAVSAQQSDSVRVQVELVRPSASDRSPAQHPDASNVAVWLTPLDAALPSRPAQPPPRLVQKNKVFTPHVLVVQAGASVEFPNEDPFFHNVFSLFAGKRFDLGLYESGSSRAVHFDRPGASFLFCNIHPEMSAVVVVVPTPFYGLSDAAGRVNIAAVPDGRYQLKLWHERSSPDELKTWKESSPFPPRRGPSDQSASPIAVFSHLRIRISTDRTTRPPLPTSPTEAASAENYQHVAG
jgi:hypothetical protein